MREIYAQLAQRIRAGLRCAVATLVEVRDALPAPIGTSLLVDADGSFIGNIGAGCHEGEIVERAQQAMTDGVGCELEFTLDDELLDGSICGASLRVAIWIPDAALLPQLDLIANGREAVTLRVAGRPIVVAPKRELVIVGATDLAAHLTRVARAIDFRVTLLDPRPAFATAGRHPQADRIVSAWPQDELAALLTEASAIAIIAHDVKIDLPAIEIALASPVPYIGVLGSRRAQRARNARLQEAGHAGASFARLHGPAGLDLGGAGSAQTALSILAEMLASLNGRIAAPLRSLDDSIH